MGSFICWGIARQEATVSALGGMMIMGGPPTPTFAKVRLRLLGYRYSSATAAATASIPAGSQIAFYRSLRSKGLSCPFRPVRNRFAWNADQDDGLARGAELDSRPLDHDGFRSGRPKNMNVIDSKKLERMRAENRAHFSSPRSRLTRSVVELTAGNEDGRFPRTQGGLETALNRPFHPMTTRTA